MNSQNKLIRLKNKLDVITYLINSKGMGHKIKDVVFQLEYDSSNNMWGFSYYGYVSYRFMFYNEDLDKLLITVEQELHKIVVQIKNR